MYCRGAHVERPLLPQMMHPYRKDRICWSLSMYDEFQYIRPGVVAGGVEFHVT